MGHDWQSFHCEVRIKNVYVKLKLLQVFLWELEIICSYVYTGGRYSNEADKQLCLAFFGIEDACLDFNIFLQW